MDQSNFRWSLLLFPIASWLLLTCPLGAHAQDAPLNNAVVNVAELTDEGPSAALAFEKSFRDENGHARFELRRLDIGE